MRTSIVIFLLASLTLSCGGDPEEPVPVIDVSGSWNVQINLSVSTVGGGWVCSFANEPVFNFSQTGPNFTGTVAGGTGGCSNNANETASIDLDGQRILNGLVEPTREIAFNIDNFDNLLTGMIAPDATSITGRIELTVVLPPGVAELFIGSWSATKN